jgi:hypothetical protein
MNFHLLHPFITLSYPPLSPFLLLLFCSMSHTPSPFMFWFYFWDKVSLTFVHLASNLQSLCFYFPSSWDCKSVPPCLASFIIFSDSPSPLFISFSTSLRVPFYFHVLPNYSPSRFYIWKKTCNTSLCESGLFHLTSWSPLPSIFQQTTWFHSSYL